MVNTADTNPEIKTTITRANSRKDKLQLLAATAATMEFDVSHTSAQSVESQEMMSVVYHILDSSSDNAALSDKENKETILSYFKDKDMNAQKFISMNRKEFAKKLISHGDNNKLKRGPACQLHKLISSKLINIKQEDEVEEEEKKMSGDSTVIAMLSVDEIVNMLNEGFDKLKEKPSKEHRDLIIKYFMENQIDGPKLLSIERTQFAHAISEYCNEKKMTGAAAKLFSFLKKQLKESGDDSGSDEDDEMPQKPIRENTIYFKNTHNEIVNSMKDLYPSYIYKSIWDKSEDENLEILIDDCVRKVQKQFFWNDSFSIEQLYEDGANLTGDDEQKDTYYDFVKKVYLEAGGNRFFDKFVAKRYKREIRVWKYMVESEKVLKTDEQIAEAIKLIDFKEFDIDKDFGIDFYEFQKCFRKLGYFVEKQKLREIFDEIDGSNDKDGTITKREYRDWKEQKNDLFDKRIEQDDEAKHDSWYVYYDDNRGIYDFNDAEKSDFELLRGKKNHVAILKQEINDDMKWALYVNKLTKNQRRLFTASGQATNIPKGYWIILDEDHDENKRQIPLKSFKAEMALKKHLDALYQLLHHYYMLNISKKMQKQWKDDNTPLRKLYCPDLDSQIKSVKRKSRRRGSLDQNQQRELRTGKSIKQKDIKFRIEGTEYKLTWWNQKGKREANAITLINLTELRTKEFDYEQQFSVENLQEEKSSTSLRKNSRAKLRPKGLEINYMRFGCDPQKTKLLWQWYDNDKSQYREFECGTAVTEQLEVSFLSNVKQNFDPVEYKEQFNNCMLTKLREYFERLGSKNKDYTFRVTFSGQHEKDEDRNNIILNMEQISFDHNKSSPFARNIKRMIDGRNALDFLYRNSDSFAEKWQMRYRLYTEHQQLYFFSYIISVVTMMKYIDIEFSNQPVVLPLFIYPKIEQDVIEELIQPRDVMKEQKVSSLFQGCLIPPEGIWKAAISGDGDGDIQPTKTNTLKKAVLSSRPRDEHESKQTKEIELYVQDKTDYPHLYFTKEQAEFLRLLECVRKYALEFEAGNAEYKLWPWYRNSFHSNTSICADLQNYDDLIYKHNLAKSWPLSELMGYLKKRKTKNKATSKSKPKGEPIRFKRKFAAEMLLGPQTISRNINLLRNQLDSLLKDIMDKALTEHFNKGNIKSDHKVDLGKTITLIALKQNLTKRHQDKQQAITNYCSNQILGNLQTLQELKKDDITKIIHNICELNHDSELPETAFVRFINDEKIDGAELSKRSKDAFVNALIEKNPKNDEKQDEEKKDDGERYKKNVEKLWKLFTQHISSKQYWNDQLEETNTKFKIKNENKDQYGLFDENIKNLHTLDIDRYELPIFREFVQFFFVNSDKEQYNLIADPNSNYLGGDDHSWYNAFIESWRSVPIWFTYDHDVLLLELVLRNGLNCDKILQDLDGENATQYKIRLDCDERKTIDDPYYEFRRYCSIRYNLYHRLKYVTNVLVKNLQNPEYGGNVPLVNIRIPDEKDRPTYILSGLLFCDYQREVHTEYVQHIAPQLHFDQQVKKVISERSVPIHKTTRTNKCCGGCCSQRRSERYCCFFKKGKTYCRLCKKEKPPPPFERPQSKYQRLDFNEIDDEDFDYLRNKMEIEFEGQDENISTAITKIDSMDGIMNWSSPQLRSTGRLSHSYINQRRRTLHQISLPTSKMDPKKYTSPSMLALGGIKDIEDNTDESGESKRYRYTDPFTERDMNNELLHALQTFNLMIYGSSLVECIIRQLEKQKRPAYWHILGEVLNALPYPLAISAVNNPAIKDVLRHAAKPATLNTICLRLVQGSSFQTSACLGIAEFFEDISKKDMVQEDIWKSYSEQFEKLAYEQMSHIESNHLLFVILNIPLTQHDGKSLFELALDEKRIGFLNNDRINDVINHLYQSQFLSPTDQIIMKQLKHWEILELLITHPFKFYFRAQGYHWTAGMLFMLYLGFIMAYVFFRPIGGEEVSLAIEIPLWTMNVGYILYEVEECIEKGFSDYLGVGVKGQTNVLDVCISLLWLILLIMRVVFIVEKNETDSGPLQQTYIFLFGVQIMLLTMRGLILFSNNKYLGTLVRVIKLMLVEIAKFLSIFGIVMAGFGFGLWLMSAANQCDKNEEIDDCEDYEISSIGNSLKYVFQVFIGTGDLDGVIDSGIAIVFMILATLFGHLILTNLLIALMTTEYEKVQDDAKGEVIYNQADLTYDLSCRSRIMPPPLNIIVLVIALIGDWINFIIAMIRPKWNMYTHIDHQSFFNLQNFHILHWEYDEGKWRPVRGNQTKYKTRIDIIKWYFTGWWYDWVKNDCKCNCMTNLCRCRCCCCYNKNNEQQNNDEHNNNNNENEQELNTYWRIHHKACYGLLILRTGTNETYKGITMSQYLELYENVQRQKIDTADKQLLKQLTANTLFCEYCYRPFLKDNVSDELTTPYMALLDYISAIVFVIIPIAYIPLILLFSILAFFDCILGQFKDKHDEIENYKHTDFDKEYFANQFQTI